ncbi:hypothetical protein SBADM41S_11997 [Streptomyces badius]
MTTSAAAARRRRVARPPGLDRFEGGGRALSRPRSFHHRLDAVLGHGARPWAGSGEVCRRPSTTSAPKSPSRVAARGPARGWPRSRTRRPVAPAGSSSSQSRARSAVVKERPWLKAAVDGVVEVVVLGHAVDVLGERGGGRQAVPGVGGEQLGGHTVRREPGGEGPVPGGPGGARMPDSGSFSTGLPRRQPAARPSQAACSRSRPMTGAASGGPGHCGQAATTASRPVGSSAANGDSSRASWSRS